MKFRNPSGPDDMLRCVLDFVLQMKEPGKVGILRIVGGRPVRFTFIDADESENEAFDLAFPKGGADAKSTP